jgi:hypothetical protein
VETSTYSSAFSLATLAINPSEQNSLFIRLYERRHLPVLNVESELSSCSSPKTQVVAMEARIATLLSLSLFSISWSDRVAEPNAYLLTYIDL